MVSYWLINYYIFIFFNLFINSWFLPRWRTKKNTRNGGTLRLDATFIRDQLSEEDPKPASLRRYAWDFPSCIASSYWESQKCMETSNFFRPWAWKVRFYQNKWAWNFGWLMMFLAEKHHHFGDELGSEMEIILVYKWWLVDNKPIIGIYPNNYPNYIPLMVSTNYFYKCSLGIPSQSWFFFSQSFSGESLSQPTSFSDCTGFEHCARP